MTIQPHIFFNEVNERQGSFHRRALMMGGLAGMGMLALSGRLMELQLVEAGRYKQLSASNQFNYRLIPPPRGRILDRNGVELASNRPNFRLLVSRDEVADIDVTLASVGQVIEISDDRRKQLQREFAQSSRYIPVAIADDLSWDAFSRVNENLPELPGVTPDIDATLDAVGTLIPMPPERRKQILKDFAQSSRSVPVAIADDLTWDEFARINARLPELPGVTPDLSEVRVYNYGGAFAHVIGYVSRVSEGDLDKASAEEDQLLLHHPGFRIGKQGVEQSEDLDLRGKAGGQKVEVDAKGRVVRKDPSGDVQPVPGKDIVLSLDADIQNRALEVFGEESGAAVMMDCRTGDVLCLMSAPSFDANRFVKGMGGKDYGALASYERKPLFNKALTATYPPGSTFKTMVAIAALEQGISPQRTYVCNGSWAWGGRVWHCDKHHGAMNMHDAISTSCDIFFYQTALSVGPDKIAEMARRFGLGEVFNLGIPGQKPGLVPDPAYKRRHFPKDPVWHPGETPSMGIGQGYLNLNPLQLCVMTARLANGSRAIQPRLIESIGGVMQPSGAQAPDLPVAREHMEFVRNAMAAVTETGTAAAVAQLGLGPIKMAGKTGTAQSHSYGAGSRATLHLDWALRDHAWFVAFAPYDDPRYALSVLVEHGGWGASAAAPRAREIMRVALLKDPEVRARIEKPLPLPAIPEGEVAEGAAPPPPTDLNGNPAPTPGSPPPGAPQ